MGGWPAAAMSWAWTNTQCSVDAAQQTYQQTTGSESTICIQPQDMPSIHSTPVLKMRGPHSWRVHCGPPDLLQFWGEMSASQSALSRDTDLDCQRRASYFFLEATVNRERIFESTTVGNCLSHLPKDTLRLQLQRANEVLAVRHVWTPVCQQCESHPQRTSFPEIDSVAWTRPQVAHETQSTGAAQRPRHHPRRPRVDQRWCAAHGRRQAPAQHYPRRSSACTPVQQPGARHPRQPRQSPGRRERCFEATKPGRSREMRAGLQGRDWGRHSSSDEQELVGKGAPKTLESHSHTSIQRSLQQGTCSLQQSISSLHEL